MTEREEFEAIWANRPWYKEEQTDKDMAFEYFQKGRQSALQSERQRDGISLEARHWLEIAETLKSFGTDEDCLSTEWRVEECDKQGVQGDDDKPHFYPAVMYEVEYFEEGVVPVGDELIKTQPPQGE